MKMVEDHHTILVLVEIFISDLSDSLNEKAFKENNNINTAGSIELINFFNFIFLEIFSFFEY